DVYTAQFTVGPSTAQTLPLVQDFESGDAVSLAGWSFAVSTNAPSNGTIDVTGAENPYLGGYHLRFTNGTANVHTMQEAVLKLDLSAQAGATNLVLDFWLQRSASSQFGSTFQLLGSGNGTTWTQLVSFATGSPGQYLHFVYDLDQLLAGASVALDSDV